jgi:hypothetical protein
MTVSDARITLHFDVHEPIELMDLTLSFGSLARQYRKYVIEKLRDEGKKAKDAEIKLYITKIENNCILAELAGAHDILGTLFSVMDYTNIFVDFVKNINTAIQYFRSIVGKDSKTIIASEIPYSKRQCEDLANFLNVVAEKGDLGLSVAEFDKESGNEKVHVSFKYTSSEAYEAKKGSILAQSILEQTGDADYKDVLMYFHQANVDESKADGRTGEKAFIKSVYPKELPVYIISDLDRDRIKSLKSDPKMNMFTASYRVDVNVEKDRNDIPKYYRVLKVHEIIPDENT